MPLVGYTQLRELGAGASGRVVHAVHDATNTPVAIKYVSAELLAAPGFRERFREEARLLGTITDPNVVTFYDYVEQADGAAIVMELVDGVTLRRVLDAGGAMAPEVALVLLKGSLRGLAAAHAAGVVHRDYKPANVLVRLDGTSKLADFGVAVRAGATVPAEGTPAYLAPEQWRGAPPSPLADVYAATVVCFECLAGRRLFAASDLTELSRAHQEAPVPVDAVPEPVRQLIGHGLAKDPAARPASATAFLSELSTAARAGYGKDWEEQGRKKLAALLIGFGGAALLPTSKVPGEPAAAPPAPHAPRPRVPRSVLIGGAAVIVAAAVIATVLIVGGDDPGAPPAEPTTSAVAAPPETPPTDPGKIEVIILDQVGERTAEFTYELEGCCEQQFSGEGRVGQLADGSAVEVTDYFNIPEEEQGRGAHVRGVVLPDTTYVAQGEEYAEFPTEDLTTEPTGRIPDAESDARGLVDVHQAVGLDHVMELLTGAEKLDVRESGDGIVYRGELPPAPSTDTQNPFRELGTTFELTLDATTGRCGCTRCTPTASSKVTTVNS
jgi:protein kinase-like protein